MKPVQYNRRESDAHISALEARIVRIERIVWVAVAILAGHELSSEDLIKILERIL